MKSLRQYPDYLFRYAVMAFVLIGLFTALIAGIWMLVHSEDYTTFTTPTGKTIIIHK